MALPTTYVFWNISFEIFCIISTALLLYKQVTAFNQGDSERALSVVLVLQLLYIASFIPRVLVDVAILPKTQFSVYLVTIVNILLFMYCCYRVFIFLELYQGTPGFKLWGNKIIYAIPILFNMITLLSSPITGIFMSVAPDATSLSGPLWRLMVVIDCFYPSAAVVSYVYRFRKNWKEAGDFGVTIAFPLFYAVFGPLSALQWRIPILPFGLMLAELFVYIHYTDLLAKERASRLEYEKEVANQQNQAKSTFLSNMSHDIRTPMNAIIGYTDLARREGTSEAEMREFLDKINSSSQHLLALINDVLEMSRIESGRMSLEPVRTDLVDTMGEVRDMFATQMESKEITYTVDAEDVKNRAVMCDKNRLNRVLLNLLSNAFKFTPEGGTVSVTLRQTGGTEETGEYELRVKDSGIGMSPEFAAKVFEAFEREQTSTVSGIQGTGLGMAITKSIIDLMGGTIEVQTAQGKGTEFIVRLPLALAENAESPDGSGPVEKAAQEIDFSEMKLLLVEDNEINREIATMLLEEAGFSLDTAENGQIAVDKVKSSLPGEYDFVLMDVQMPVMNGYEATRAIRALEDPSLSRIPIIAMTANAFAEDIKAAEEAGMNGHIAKPINVAKMLETITSTLSKNVTKGS